MTLYIDCDDTLVIWLGEDGQPLEGQNPYGGGAEKWVFNQPLIDAVVAADPADIVIWSGGGFDYAARWRRLLGWGEFHQGVQAMSKDTRVPKPDDLCIDDMPIKVACEVMTPQEFIEAHS